MELSPYLENLRRDLASAAAPGGDEITRAASLLAASLEASARLCLMEALSDAAAEITAKLNDADVDANVEVRLRGREADLVVTHTAPEPERPAPVPSAPVGDGEQARITLRLPEHLKEAVERAAAAEGVSTNAWLVRAIAAATRPAPPPPGPGFTVGRRITGFAQA
jgi:hypothetical protein